MNRRTFLASACTLGILGTLRGFSGFPLGFASQAWAASAVDNATATAASLPSTPKTARTARLMAAGDVLVHDHLRMLASLPGNGYDFTSFFEHITPLLRRADLAMANLETPIAGEKAGYSGFPSFNSPDGLATSLKYAGFGLLNAANNHALDRNWSGLLRTLETLESTGLQYIGAYQSAEDKAKRLLLEVNGIQIGFLAYTYATNGEHKPKKGAEWRLGIIDPAVIKEEIALVKELGAEFVVVNLHFGEEYHRMPDTRQTKLVDALFEAGADLVLGHHPHVVQPFRRITTAERDQAVIYSMGNIISNQRQPYTDMGVVFDCTLTIDAAGKKSLGEIRLHPVCRHIQFTEAGTETFRMLPMREAVSNPEAYGLTPPAAATMAVKLVEMDRLLYSLQVKPAAPVKKKGIAGNGTGTQEPGDADCLM